MPLEDDRLERPDLYVLARFLDSLWRDQRPRRRTDLQLAVRLNYTVYKRYLEWMERKGLVVVGEAISITPKGVETYKTLVTWIKDAVGEDSL
ncbi:MAG TPA: winged helix-turn-helix domain-containing protein [Candidatus Thermoplasmatota archaeon]|nr:winged helix-turn-helix domain-containing protein [Candidatus Thermoplasmatota archaeon]